VYEDIVLLLAHFARKLFHYLYLWYNGQAGVIVEKRVIKMNSSSSTSEDISPQLMVASCAINSGDTNQTDSNNTTKQQQVNNKVTTAYCQLNINYMK